MKVSKNIENFLKDGEEVISSLTGNSYTTSSNVIVRLIFAIIRIISVILGSPTRKSVVCTSSRLIIENNKKMLYFFDQSSEITAVAPRGVMQVGYSFKRSWLIFKNHYLTLVLSGSPQELVLSKNGYDGVMEMINATETLRERIK